MQNTSPISSFMLASYDVIALKSVTLVSSKKSMPVELFDFDFAVAQVDNFCKNELIIVIFKLFEGKDASFFSNRNDNRVCLFICSTIFL